MSLRETLEKWPHDRLVKELHATAKRNAQLEDEAQALRHQVFWLGVRDQKLCGFMLEVLECWWPFAYSGIIGADQVARDLREKLNAWLK